MLREGRASSKANKPTSPKPVLSRSSQSPKSNYNQDNPADRCSPQAFISFKYFPLEATNLSGACQHGDTILSNEKLVHWSECAAPLSVRRIWGLIKRFATSSSAHTWANKWKIITSALITRIHTQWSCFQPEELHQSTTKEGEKHWERGQAGRNEGKILKKGFEKIKSWS